MKQLPIFKTISLLKFGQRLVRLLIITQQMSGPDGKQNYIVSQWNRHKMFCYIERLFTFSGDNNLWKKNICDCMMWIFQNPKFSNLSIKGKWQTTDLHLWKLFIIEDKLLSSWLINLKTDSNFIQSLSKVIYVTITCHYFLSWQHNWCKAVWPRVERNYMTLNYYYIVNYFPKYIFVTGFRWI